VLVASDRMEIGKIPGSGVGPDVFRLRVIWSNLEALCKSWRLRWCAAAVVRK
jgi:hypothetical protein